MFLTVNNEVMGVARCQIMPHIRHCYITYHGVNRACIFVAQVDECLRVISTAAGNRPRYSPRQYTILLPGRSLSRDIVKKHNYSV